MVWAVWVAVGGGVGLPAVVHLLAVLGMLS